MPDGAVAFFLFCRGDRGLPWRVSNEKKNRWTLEMKVLFLKEVENVAAPGEVKEVAAGFARNYLLPKQFAVVANSSTLKQHEAVIEQERKVWRAHQDCIPDKVIHCAVAVIQLLQG